MWSIIKEKRVHLVADAQRHFRYFYVDEHIISGCTLLFHTHTHTHTRTQAHYKKNKGKKA